MTGAIQGWAVAALLVALAGCTDNYVDLTGVYEVDLDVGSSPCGADTPVAQPWPFVKIAESTILTGFWMRGCSDAATTVCSGDMVLDSLTEPFETGWAGFMYGTEAGPPCLLVYKQRIAKLDAGKLTIDITEHRDEARPGECSAAYAEALSTSLPCVRHERIEATQLAQR